MKIGFFNRSGALNFGEFGNFQLSKIAKIHQNKKIGVSECAKWADFALVEFSKLT